MAESSINRQKTLWEKEKLLITNNFSFYHSVLRRLVLQTCKNQGLFVKELKKAFETLFEKEQMLVTSICSVSNQVFYSSELYLQFFSHNYFAVFYCFQFKQLLNVVWKIYEKLLYRLKEKEKDENKKCKM